ncbi:uncharacterized protein [Dermacentor albipictus]|uniref:uncharacterized protein isoform X2 n=1 Tax=Dermacentor albipictus TaxID=60249 RepID=UPI0038FC9D8E
MGTQTAVFDATGKYPTGVLQVTRVDLGAFDECLETEVRDSSGNVSSRGQYCNLQIQPKTDALGPKEMEFVSAMVHPKEHTYCIYGEDPCRVVPFMEAAHSSYFPATESKTPHV